MSSSDNPVAFMMSAMLKPMDFNFLAISIALDCSPSARPISMPFITPFSSAVSKLFFKSRYCGQGTGHCPAGIFKNIISNVTKNEEAGHGPVPCP